LVGNVDVMPTLLALADVPVPDTCQGANALTADRDCIVTYSEVGPTYRVRTREWAYVFRGGGGADQLYDLGTDPHELDNLAATRAARKEKERLLRRLAFWFAEHPARAPGPAARSEP
jgi:arylsulfatase A-like enzyme